MGQVILLSLHASGLSRGNGTSTPAMCPYSNILRPVASSPAQSSQNINIQWNQITRHIQSMWIKQLASPKHYQVNHWIFKHNISDLALRLPLFRDRNINCTLFRPEPNQTRHRIFPFVSLLIGTFTVQRVPRPDWSDDVPAGKVPVHIFLHNMYRVTHKNRQFLTVYNSWTWHSKAIHISKFQYFIWSKTGVLNFIAVRYSLLWYIEKLCQK